MEYLTKGEILKGWRRALITLSGSGRNRLDILLQLSWIALIPVATTTVSAALGMTHLIHFSLKKESSFLVTVLHK